MGVRLADPVHEVAMNSSEYGPRQPMTDQPPPLPPGRREARGDNRRVLKTCAVVAVLLIALVLIGVGTIPAGLGSVTNIPDYLFRSETLATYPSPDGKYVVKIVEDKRHGRRDDRIPVYVVCDSGWRPRVMARDEVIERPEPNVVWTSDTTFDVWFARLYGGMEKRRIKVKK
jgi:hypothetical protein